MDAIPYDIPGVEYTHYQDKCTFDYIVEKHSIQDQAVHTIAKIVRAADTDRHDLASQASGLWAITAGLSHNIKDDHVLLDIGLVIYDGLYSWAKYLQDKRHTESPTEILLIEIYRKYIKKKKSKEVPDWVNDLRSIIQDNIDTDLNMTLKELSENVNVNPAYLSRKFSEYFDNMNFGEYMRRLRIEKALELMENNKYSLAEIALISGFSDQSHFSRVFKEFNGSTPKEYRKQNLKK